MTPNSPIDLGRSTVFYRIFLDIITFIIFFFRTGRGRLRLLRSILTTMNSWL